jgi:hypothetical protein
MISYLTHVSYCINIVEVHAQHACDVINTINNKFITNNLYLYNYVHAPKHILQINIQEFYIYYLYFLIV